MDGTIHPTPTQQGLISSIDDRLYLEGGDISLDYSDHELNI